MYPVLNGGTTYLPVRTVSGMLGIGVDWDGAAQTVLLDTSKKTTPTKTDGKASANGWEWPDAPNGGISFRLKLDQWVNIPLLGSSGDYQLTITPYYSKAEQNAHNPDEPYPENFYVAITADIEDEDAWMLLSNAYVDFENAPKTVAKAAELTKNCKTDAEKITAIFEFVAKTIKYDYRLYNAEQKLLDAGESYAVAESSRNFSLDNILTSKTGVCQHYAVLMAGMLRSLGIPCKVVRGDAYDGKEWVAHAWVSVSPDTKGLNMTRLGAGHDEDGWIRLDPTWGNSATSRAAAAVDKNHKSYYAY